MKKRSDFAADVSSWLEFADYDFKTAKWNLKKFGINVSAIEKAAQVLDKYYISTRYPGQYGGPEGLYDESDAHSAIAAAKSILQFVKNKI